MVKMDKKALRSFPRPTVTTAMRQRSRKEDAKKGVATTERCVIGGIDTLVVNCFKKDQKALVPHFRIFCQMDGDITQRLNTDKVRWSEGTFWNNTGGVLNQFWGYPCVTEEDEKRVSQFIEDYSKLYSINVPHPEEYTSCIYAYQDDIRRRRNIEKHKAMFDHVDSQMALFGALPDDYEHFVKETVYADCEFLFYSKKANHAYCTHCGRAFRLHDETLKEAGVPTAELNPKHNDFLTCPYCGKTVQAKSEGYSRGKMVFPKWSMLVAKSGKKVLVRYIRHIRDFRKDFKNPKTETVDLYRTVHEEGQYEDYEYGRRHISGGEGWRYPYKPSPLWNPSEFAAPRSVVLYNTDWEVLKDTCLQYSCTELWLEKFAGEKKKPWALDSWWIFYQKYPFVEQFMKLGWCRLVGEIYDEYGRGSAKSFTNGKNICETLKMTRNQFKFLRSVSYNNPAMMDILIMRYASAQGVRMSEDDHKMLRVICKSKQSNLYKNLIDLGEYVSMYKIIKWLLKQEKNKNFHIGDYLNDYLRWAKDLGYDLHIEQNLLPDKFYRRHDALQIEYTEKHSAIKAAEFAEFNRILAEMQKTISEEIPTNMHAEGLFIRAPYELEELRKEGEMLHHCVATYMDRVAQGKTMIFFIREEKAPDRPFYTLEWNNHQMIQCRGKNNCAMTPKVKAFTQVFSEKMLAFETEQATGKRARVKVV